uniref:MFS domain-containing protein n=1 Tax=Trichobilharzia regenti TaxID=157069 RepID=A0AA85J7F3_TRIRE|nr:unnamed protein product [Trichobilharzia regenti]
MKEKTRNLIFGCISVFGGILIHFAYGFFYSTANLVPYMMGYTITYVDPHVSPTLSIWLSALALAMEGVAMPFGGVTAKRFGCRIVVAASCLLDRQFTNPEVLDRVPVAFLILGGIVSAIHVVGFCLLRAKPIQSAHNSELEMTVRNRIHSDHNAFIVDREFTEEEPRILRLCGKCFQSIMDIAPNKTTKQEVNVPPKQLLRHIDFYLLWFVMFCDIIPITIITSVYKLFGQQLINDDQFLSIVATLSSVFNAGGRIAWGGTVDRLSFKIPMTIMHIIWAVVLLSFPHIGGLTGDSLKAVYAIWVFVLHFSLSGVFTIQPAATGVVFGPLNMAVNYGCVFSAFAVGSILCGIISTVITNENAYVLQFTSCGCICIVGLFASFWIEDRKISPRYRAYNFCAAACPTLRVGYCDPDAIEVILEDEE